MAKIKGHYLDELFGDLHIESDGEPIANDVTTLDFSEDFGVTYDSAAKKVTITLEGGGSELEGDVEGPSDDNRVVQISGDEETETVSVRATGFQWHPDAVPEEPALIIGEDGSIELWHDASRALKAAAGGTTIGNSTSLNRITGALAVTRRHVNSSPVNLDTTTTDLLVTVNASSERTVRLPTPSDGRLVAFIIQGSSTVTIQRNASEMINGVAGNYIPLANSRFLAWSDGTDWYTFATLADVINAVASSRLINTTAPLTGGGNLTADRTIAIDNATAGAVGVIQLAGNLGGTATTPLVDGLTADTITVQNADASHKGVWTTTGLRIGDNASPTDRMEVVGNFRTEGGWVRASRSNAASTLAVADACMNLETPSGGQGLLVFSFAGSPAGGIRADNVGNFNWHSSAGGYHQFYRGLDTSTPVANLTDAGLAIGFGAGTAATQKLDVNGPGRIIGKASLGTGGNSTHAIVGGVDYTVRFVSGDVTIDTTTKDYLLYVDATGAARNITLPTATDGRMLFIKRSAGTNAVNVLVSGGVTIDGDTDDIELITDDGEGINPFIVLGGDGSGKWHILGFWSIARIVP